MTLLLRLTNKELFLGGCPCIGNLHFYLSYWAKKNVRKKRSESNSIRMELRMNSRSEYQGCSNSTRVRNTTKSQPFRAGLSWKFAVLAAQKRFFATLRREDWIRRREDLIGRLSGWALKYYFGPCWDCNALHYLEVLDQRVDKIGK